MRLLERLAGRIDLVNDRIGRGVAWLALIMVLAQFVIVVMRYVFGLGSVAMQESVVYMHATVFLLASGYTLLHNAHVRCDIFYAGAPARRRAIIDLFGVLAFLIPTCVGVAWVAWPYVASSWAVWEGSSEGSLGLPAVFALKTVILLFTAAVFLQGLSLGARALLTLAGRRPRAGSGDASTVGPERD
ncbi:MAG: TRAP transporter small permease subunit [Gammaproteobacteria bacterium]